MNSVKTIAADLEGQQRKNILASFPPVHPNVYAYHVTAAYGNLAGVTIHGLHTAQVMGQVITDQIQTLVLMIDGSCYRPDGKLWHLTLSVADGVSPKEGGSVSLDQMESMDEFLFTCLFRRRNAKQDVPETASYYA